MTARTQALLPLWTHLTVTLRAILDSTSLPQDLISIAKLWSIDPVKCRTNKTTPFLGWNLGPLIKIEFLFYLVCLSASFCCKLAKEEALRPRSQAAWEEPFTEWPLTVWAAIVCHSQFWQASLPQQAWEKLMVNRTGLCSNAEWLWLTQQRDTCSLDSPLFIEVQAHLCLSSS